MSDITDQQVEKLKQGHRFFAVTLFNRAWEHLMAASENPEEKERALQAAYGSLYHWSEIGEPINITRGEWMISHVASLLDRPEPALHHAERCLSMTLMYQLQGFDLAYSYEAMARAYACAGNAKQAFHYKQLAREAGIQIPDEADRQQLEADLADDNWFGI